VAKPDTIILVMSNPDVRQRSTDAELQLKGAEADLANLEATLENDLINQQAQQMSAESEYNKAKLDYEANKELAQDGLIADIILKKSQVTAQELNSKNEMEKKKVESNAKSAAARIGAQKQKLSNCGSPLNCGKNSSTN